MTLKKALILGISGLVGQALAKKLEGVFQVYGTYKTTTFHTLCVDQQFQASVENTDDFVNIVRTVQPDIIISCLRGDFPQQLALHEQLAKELISTNTVFYFCSTTNVFDGEVTKHHTEQDVPKPVSDYGQFKVACEYLLTNHLGQRAIIFRLPQVWGKTSTRLHDLKSALANATPIKMYDNVAYDVTTDVFAARYISYVIENGLTGIFHVGSTNICLEVDFKKKLASALSDDPFTIQLETIPNHDLYYFGLQSIRSDIPSDILYTSDDVIQSLIS